MKRSIEKERVSHAYLFYGMQGIGKRTSAMAFAKALNCKKEKNDSCDSCATCIKIDRGVHPDVITIEPEGLIIKIKNIREVQNQIKFRPFEGKKRVFIIVDAEKMNSPSANALLKTLEEPNPSNTLILVTSRPYQLPETIISRCQKIRFDPIRKDAIESFLEKEAFLDRKSASILASSSRGSIGRALEMMEQSYITFKSEMIDKVINWDKAHDPLSCFSFIDDFGDGRQVIAERLDILRDWYRDILIYKETGDPEYLINQDIMDSTKDLSEKLSGEDILNRIQAINRAYRAIEQNANKQLTLELMMFKLLPI
ncbi:MAG: DNA polymerase III subunit delta' [Deltaproteobacteria bacterium]|nr:DNA polymerase III subunit delta' [Deltaproteobacteria bacterium]